FTRRVFALLREAVPIAREDRVRCYKATLERARHLRVLRAWYEVVTASYAAKCSMADAEANGRTKMR
ncbi:hypothetical protein Pmar_PMAR006437, partial [Perkinsus marinus ATCC 50983]